MLANATCYLPHYFEGIMGTLVIEQYRELERTLLSLIGPVQWGNDIHMKLGRITRLLELLGNPHHRYRSVHVGGTSGKGTTAVLTAHLLQQMGYKTGLHVSPHIQLFNERMQINGRLAPTSKLFTLLQTIKPLVEQVGRDSPYGNLTYFEIQAALAFTYFAQEQVDVAVVEVGLGGLLDATNVLPADVAVLTNVGLDHTEVLGETVELIAEQKVGIFKAGQQVITAVSQPTVRQIVADRCREVGATLHWVEHGPTFQDTNRACAAAAAAALAGRPLPADISWDVPLPARLETMQTNPTVILDGAHNPDKIRATAHAVHTRFPNKAPIIVFAAKAGKDVADMLPYLLPHAKAFVTSQFSAKGLWKAVAATELTAVVHQLAPDLPVYTEPDPLTAVRLALSLAQPDDLIWITGSLYFAGDAREQWYSLEQLVEQAEIGLAGSLLP